MAVAAIGPYEFQPKDRLENFHGNQVVYLHWEDHLMFCAPVAFPLPPDMPFAAFHDQIVPAAYAQHPDFAAIDWTKAEWKLDGAPFTPEPAQGLRAQGIGHKSVLVLRTPGLTGLHGSHA